MPYFGSPSPVLSIFTVTAQRFFASSCGSGLPVSGQTRGAAGFLLAAGVTFFALLPPPPHETNASAANATTSATTRTRRSRRIPTACSYRAPAWWTRSHGLEGADPVVDRGMRVEQVVPLGVALVRLLVERLLDPQVR